MHSLVTSTIDGLPAFCPRSHLRGWLALDLQRLHVPDSLGILVNTPVAREEAHTSNSGDGLGGPLFGVLEALVNELLRLDVRSKVVGYKVVVAMVNNAIDKRRELVGIAKRVVSNGIKDIGKRRVQFVLRVHVCVTKVLDIFGQVTEKEDVLVANLTGNLNLSRGQSR